MRCATVRLVCHASVLASLAVGNSVYAAAEAELTEKPPAAEQPRGERGPRVQMQQMQRQAAPDADATRREAYLGVVTGPVAEQLRAQLDIPEGVGLVVEEVPKDGPAGRAGLKRFDILLECDDQLICNAPQLATLVKAAGKGKEVAFKIVRGGKAMEVKVMIGEREVDVDAAGEPPAGFGGNPLAMPFPMLPGGHSQRVVAHADQRGAVEIRETDGKRTVTVKDRAGRQVHAGPLDTDADRRKVPAAFRALVDEVEARLGGRAGAARKPAVDGEI